MKTQFRSSHNEFYEFYSTLLEVEFIMLSYAVFFERTHKIFLLSIISYVLCDISFVNILYTYMSLDYSQKILLDPI